jgi:hypothetical protein
MEIFQFRNCPICNCSSSKKFISSDFPLDSSSTSLEYFNGLWHGLDKSSHFLDYQKCLSCGCVYSSKYFKESSLNDLYKSMPPNMELISERLIQKTQLRYASFFVKSISKWLSSRKDQDINILELGSDTGIFVTKLVQIITDKKNNINPTNVNIISIEPNLDVHPVLRENLKKSMVNFQIFESFDKYLDASDKPIDIVIAIHVLDHIITPKYFLHEIAKRGNSEFYLYGVVHNVESVLAYSMGKRWPPFCLQHPQVYSRKTLAKLFYQSFSVQKLRVSRTYNDYPLSVISDFLGLSFLTYLLKSIYLTIPLGNIQFVCKVRQFTHE